MNILLLLLMKSVFADMKPLFSGISCKRRTGKLAITGNHVVYAKYTNLSSSLKKLEGDAQA